MARQWSALGLGIALTVGLLVGLAFVTGSRSPGPADGDSVDAAAEARKWLAAIELEWAPEREVAEMVQEADAIAVVDVKDQTFPVWNSENGQAWDGSVKARPWVFTRVHAVLVEQLGGKLELSSEFDFLAFGDSTVRYEQEDPPPTQYSSGGFELGDTFLVFLDLDPIPFETGDELTLTLAEGFRGNYRLHGSLAFAANEKEGIPTEELINEVEMAATG